MISIIVGIMCVYFVWRIIKWKICQPNFRNKVVWITGGSSGIGQHLAYEFCKRNVQRLIISSRNIVQLERVKKNCCSPEKVVVVEMDMTKFESVRQKTTKIIQDLEKQGKKLDIVVENAGLGMRADFLNFSFQNHLQLFVTNVDGPVNHIKAFIEHMMKNKSGQIVFISSVFSQFAYPYRSSYTASKHAITAISDSLRTQFYQYNIKVTTINPGYIKTNIAVNSLGDQAGKKYGKKDKYESFGMNVQDLSRQSTKAIYMQVKQCQVSRDWYKNQLKIICRGLFPDLFFRVTRAKEPLSKNHTHK